MKKESMLGNFSLGTGTNAPSIAHGFYRFGRSKIPALSWIVTFIFEGVPGGGGFA